MRRIATSRATVDHKFQAGNSGIGLRATQISAQWCNNVQEALATLIEAAGLALPTGADPDDYTLLLDAVAALIAADRSMPANTIRGNLTGATAPGADNTIAAVLTALGAGIDKSLNGNGYYKHPGGLIEQWGEISGSFSQGATSFNFGFAFPTACFQVQITTKLGGSPSTDNDYWVQTDGAPSTTGQGVYIQGGNGVAGTCAGWYWRALGK